VSCALKPILIAVLDPSIIRVSVAGDVLSLKDPKAVLARSFLLIKVSTVLTIDDRTRAFSSLDPAARELKLTM
jgi:hypothetical protein